MAFKFEDVLKGENLVTTAVIIGGTYFLAPFIGQVIRPLVKTAIKGGIRRLRLDRQHGRRGSGHGE